MTNAAAPTFLADFWADWLEFMRFRLKEMRVKVKATATDEQLSHAYWNARFRWVPAQPRAVLRAAEFSCPAKHQKGLEALAARFENGEDVNPFLSTTRRIGKFNDKLLNDWGVQHFHIGMTAADRNDECLFAKIVSNAVFFVHVLPHTRYTERDLVRRIHSNWPSLIERFKIPGAIPHKKDLDDDQVQTLRDKNVTTTLQMADGTVYLPPGGGLMSSGLSARVLVNSDLAFAQVKRCQAWLEANVAGIIDDFRRQGREVVTPAIFKLIVEGDHALWAIEPNAKGKFKLGSIFPPPTTRPDVEITG